MQVTPTLVSIPFVHLRQHQFSQALQCCLSLQEPSGNFQLLDWDFGHQELPLIPFHPLYLILLRKHLAWARRHPPTHLGACRDTCHRGGVDFLDLPVVTADFSSHQRETRQGMVLEIPVYSGWNGT